MPTFESVPLHDRIRQRLLEIPTLSTPYGLLSRDPETVVDLLFSSNNENDANINNNGQRDVLLAQVERLRYKVAQALHSKTLVGQQLQQHATEESSTSSTGWLEGMTTSALECKRRQQQEAKTTTASSRRAMTGCQALDNLVLGSNSTGSLLYGHVWQLSGDLGKTQLALQIAATAASTTCTTVLVDYCYSVAGHCQQVLKERHAQLRQKDGSSSASSSGRRNRADSTNISFWGISNTTQLLRRLSLLEQALLQDNQESSSPTRPRRLWIMDALSNIPSLQDAEHSSSTSSLSILATITRKCRLLARLYPDRLSVILVHHQSSLRHADVHLQLWNQQSPTQYCDYPSNTPQPPPPQQQRRLLVRLVKHPHQQVVASSSTAPNSNASSSNGHHTLTLKLTPLGLTSVIVMDGDGGSSDEDEVLPHTARANGMDLT